MPLFKVFYIFILLIFFPIATARAGGERDLIVQKVMDCVNRHLQKNAGISWNDVCDVPESSSQQHLQAVNQQMDQVQGIVPPQDVTRQNPTVQNFPPDFQILPKKPLWALEIAPEVSSIRYHEPHFMKESGVMTGINANITYHPPQGNALNSEITDVYRLETRFSYGKVNYRGGIQNGDGSVTPESFNGISDYMVELRDLAGKDFYFKDQSTRITPYLGAGYRSLYDAMFVNKPFGYDRRIQYFYIPLGAQAMTKLNDGWSIGADAEYDILIRGFVTSYLETIGLGKLTNTQKNGFGLRGSIKLIKNYNRFNFIIEPYIRFWYIQDSRVDTSTPFTFQGQDFVISGVEPKNSSIEMGGRFGIEF